ncbi:MAG: hypothetical protein L0Z55_11595 [Planctomycetes bacterium]|nr:hypothetical protein [Planctomycetota bacterium]
MADAVKEGWRRHQDRMTPRQHALCEFAEKLTRTPSAMTRADVDALRAGGLADEEIVDAVHVVGYFNHINRVADALGVDLETWMEAEKGP